MDIVKIVLSFVIAFVITFLATPLIKRIAAKIGAIDVPTDGRRMHTKPVPRLGGLAIFYGFIVSTLLLTQVDKQLGGILAGALVLILLGVFDDVYALPAKIKFPIQIIAAIIPVSCGLMIDRITMPFLESGVLEFGYLSAPITVLWIVGMTNAVNLIDGLDGLAVGVSSIATLSVFCIALIGGDLKLALITAAIVGACFGFLPFNFNPASIFMGDTGATFLGYIMATVSIMGLFKIHTVISFAVPFLVFGLPLFDTTFAIFRRIKERRPIMSPDRGHLHHRLIDMGFSHRQAVLMIYGICLVLGVCAILLSILMTKISPFYTAIVLGAIVLLAVLAMRNFSYIKKRIKKQKKEE